jgi:hypothetical protein
LLVCLLVCLLRRKPTSKPTSRSRLHRRSRSRSFRIRINKKPSGYPRGAFATQALSTNPLEPQSDSLYPLTKQALASELGWQSHLDTSDPAHFLLSARSWLRAGLPRELQDSCFSGEEPASCEANPVPGRSILKQLFANPFKDS